jgi:hypothetical protein
LTLFPRLATCLTPCPQSCAPSCSESCCSGPSAPQQAFIQPPAMPLPVPPPAMPLPVATQSIAPQHFVSPGFGPIGQAPPTCPASCPNSCAPACAPSCCQGIICYNNN